MDEIKRLYDEVNRLHKQAMAILAEFQGKEITAEKSNEVNALLDKVEQLSAQAKQLERAEEQKRRLEQVPEGNRPNTFNQQQAPANEGDKGDERQKQIKAATRRFWLTGDDQELKALSVSSQSAGGYLVADTFVDQVLMAQEQLITMRQISTVLPPVPAGSVITPTAVPLSDAGNNTETGEIVFDTVEPFGDRKLTPHEYDKGILVSNALMRNPRFDIEKWVREQGTLACSRKEENDFVNGTGNGKPYGILQTPSLPMFTTATSVKIYGDDIINWIYSLPAAYASNPKTRILCHRSFVRKVRTLYKPDSATAFAGYLWQPSLTPGTPDTIAGVPYVFSDKVDDGLDANDAWEANAVPAVVGDFSYYWIVDALELYIQRLNEKFATTKQVGFIFTKSTDGMAVLAEAFYGLKVHS